MLFDHKGKEIKDTDLYTVLRYFIEKAYPQNTLDKSIMEFINQSYVPTRKRSYPRMQGYKGANARILTKFTKKELYLHEVILCFKTLGFTFDVEIKVNYDEILNRFVHEYSTNFYDRIYIIMAMKLLEYKDIMNTTGVKNYSTINEMFSRINFKQKRTYENRRINFSNAIYTKRFYEYAINESLLRKYTELKEEPICISYILSCDKTSKDLMIEEKELDDILLSKPASLERKLMEKNINDKICKLLPNYTNVLKRKKEVNI